MYFLQQRPLVPRQALGEHRVTKTLCEDVERGLSYVQHGPRHSYRGGQRVDLTRHEGNHIPEIDAAKLVRQNKIYHVLIVKDSRYACQYRLADTAFGGIG